MLQLEDKITAAVIGPIKAGKGIFTRKAQEPRYKSILLDTVLTGNYWVPRQFSTIEEQPDVDFLSKYYAHPKQYAFEFQMRYMATRLHQQDRVDSTTGLVLTGQPLDVDKLFAEINKTYIGAAYPTYELMLEQVHKRVTAPEIVIYLQVTDPAVLRRRIKEDSRSGEETLLQGSYLQRNIESIEKYCTNLKKPLITVDAGNPAFEGNASSRFWNALFHRVAAEMRQYRQPPRLTLDEWEAVDYNRAQNGARNARRQLREYLARHQKIGNIAGLVGTGKTGLAELLGDELDIGVMRELDGRNDEVKDALLFKFLANKAAYCFELQDYLIPKRLGGRKRFYRMKKSFVEDRSPEEDQSIFWRRFHAQGYLSDEQMERLKRKAKAAYTKAPKADFMLLLERSPRESRKMILRRGRKVEVQAWPLAELEAMTEYYQGSDTVEPFAQDLRQYGGLQGPVIPINLNELNLDKMIHLGYLFQEILHGMLEYEQKSTATSV